MKSAWISYKICDRMSAFCKIITSLNHPKAWSEINSVLKHRGHVRGITHSRRWWPNGGTVTGCWKPKKLGTKLSSVQFRPSRILYEVAGDWIWRSRVRSQSLATWTMYHITFETGMWIWSHINVLYIIFLRQRVYWFHANSNSCSVSLCESNRSLMKAST